MTPAWFQQGVSRLVRKSRTATDEAIRPLELVKARHQDQTFIAEQANSAMNRPYKGEARFKNVSHALRA